MRKFGGDRVNRSDVLHAVPGNPNATLVGDLVTGQGVPREKFDCRCSQVFAALRPGGVLLAAVSGSAGLAAMIWSVGVTTGDSQQRRPVDCLAILAIRGSYGGSPWQCSGGDGVSLWSIER
jgi:hypothetical protein